MSSRKQKLRLIGAFAALVVLALATASCNGFFVDPTWQTITIQPPNPAVAVGFTLSLSAWGTDTNGQRRQITKNLVWSLSNPSSGTVATLDPNNGQLKGVNAGTVTVNASSEGVTGTATATVAQEVSSMTISPLTTSVKDDGTSFATFTVTSSGTNISSLVTLTASQNGTNVTQISCAYNSSDQTQHCTPASGLVQAGTSQTYLITVTYAGYTGTAAVTAQLTVNG